MKSIFVAAIFYWLFYMPAAHAQTKLSSKKSANSKAYSLAISEYIKAIYKPGVSKPDTLFIGKNVDMPDIQLPGTIQGINTFLVKSEDAQKKLGYRKSLVYLNVVGWINNRSSDFLIITFHEFKPQHHCSMRFSYTTSGEVKLDSLSFQYPYGHK